MDDQKGFILCAPWQAMGHSNGILSLTHLAQALRARGRKVYFCATDAWPREDNVIRADLRIAKYEDPTLQTYCNLMRKIQTLYSIDFVSDFSEEWINRNYVIYPETMLGNTLNAKYVIRYFGNKDGTLKGEKIKMHATDFVLSHSKVIYSGAHHVLFFAKVNPLFHCRDAQPASVRTLDLTYVGKGNLYGEVVNLDNTVGLGRTWPETKDQLATLLRSCRFFYTWDSWTQMNVEALYCGAIPVFLRKMPWTDAEIDGTELGVLPRLASDATLGPGFFEEFEFARKGFVERVERVMRNWEPGVDDFIYKVDRHFGASRR